LGEVDEVAKNDVVQQNIELRRRLDEEHSSYRRRLQTYQDEQQRHAQLIQKLQAKVYMVYSLIKTCLENRFENARSFTYAKHFFYKAANAVCGK